MFPCPHCGRAININAPPTEVAWYKYDPGGSKVSLGCGSLILIALIVLFFSGGRSESEAIRGLQHEVRSLEEKIDRLGEQLSANQKREQNRDNR